MKIGIIGAGSIGLLFAGYLGKIFEVTIYTRTQEQAIEINQNGIVIKKGAELIRSEVMADWVENWSGEEEVSIFAVKQYHLSSVLERLNNLKKLPNNLLFLQNGMGHLKLLNSIMAENIYVGSVEHGALKESPYIVKHNGKGVTNIAVFKGESSFIQQFAGRGSTIDFEMIYKEDYYKMLIEKLIINAVINPLTALLQVENGELTRNKYYMKAVKNLFDEISQILKIESKERYLEQIMLICEKTANNRSSMLKDIEAGRQTEVDAILGFLLEQADKEEITAPQVKNLYFLLKGKEFDRGGLS